MVRALIGGAVGGLLGAGVWAAIGVATGYEVGWIAWGLGLSVGAGVAIGARGRGSRGAGMLAALITIAAIILGKWLVYYMVVDRAVGVKAVAIAALAEIVIVERPGPSRGGLPIRSGADSYREMFPRDVWDEASRRFDALSRQQRDELIACPALANGDLFLSLLADEIALDWRRAGASLAWPEDYSAETAWREQHYPPELWSAAVERWESMTEDERVLFEDNVKGWLIVSAPKTPRMGFLRSFTLMDLLWFFLAMLTAVKIGESGVAYEE